MSTGSKPRINCKCAIMQGCRFWVFWSDEKEGWHQKLENYINDANKENHKS